MPALSLPDTVKRVDGGVVVETLERESLVGAQTPQAFLAPSLLRAFEGDIAGATDCASLVERSGGRVAVVEGDPRLLKVTTAADLALVELLVARSRGRHCGHIGTHLLQVQGRSLTSPAVSLSAFRSEASRSAGGGDPRLWSD